MLGNMFLAFVAVGIGLGAIAYGYGGVYLVIAGICLGTFAWGAAVSITSREKPAPQFVHRHTHRKPHWL